MADTLLGEWIFATTAGNPANGQIRLDNTTQNLAKNVGVSKQDTNGNDASAALAPIRLGNTLNLQNKTDATQTQTYMITGTPVDQGSYIDYPVTWKSGNQPLPGQRTTLTSVSVPVTVNVISPTLTSLVGYPAFKLGWTQPVTGQQVQALVGIAGAMSLSARIFVSGMELNAFVGDEFAVNARWLIPNQAFPFDLPIGFSPGMTMRQYYAASALQGFIAGNPAANLIGKVAEYCWKVADSMIKAEQMQAEGMQPPIAGDVTPAVSIQRTTLNVVNNPAQLKVPRRTHLAGQP